MRPVRPVGIGIGVAVLVTAVGVALGGAALVSATGLPPADLPVGAPFATSAAHPPLGTDYLGRDVASRILTGGWFIVVIPFAAVIFAELLGALTGVVLALLGRSSTAMRFLLDVVLVIPPIIVVLVVLSALGTDALALTILVTFLSVPFVSRYIHALTEPMLRTGFVEVALARGESRWRVAGTEILPNLLAPMVSDSGVRFVGAVYLVATASFLGAGTQGGAPNWAAMVHQNLDGLPLNAWAALAPAIMVAMVTVPANVLAVGVAGKVISE